MVHLDAEGTVVTLRFHAPYADGDERAYLDALEAIGAIERPFALMTVFGGRGGLSQPGEREQALWFKRTRARMDRLCLALAIVRPDASPEMATVFRKLWSFPVFATTDEEEARQRLQQELERHDG